MKVEYAISGTNEIFGIKLIPESNLDKQVLETFTFLGIKVNCIYIEGYVVELVPKEKGSEKLKKEKKEFDKSEDEFDKIIYRPKNGKLGDICERCGKPLKEHLTHSMLPCPPHKLIDIRRSKNLEEEENDYWSNTICNNQLI